MKTGNLIPRTLFTMGLLCAPAWSDVPNSKDHPLITRYPGSEIIEYLEKNFDSMDVPAGKVITTREGKYAWSSSQQVEGKYTRIRYKAPAGRNSLEVFRNYQQAIQKSEGKTLYQCSLGECDNLSFFLFTSADGVVSGNRAREFFLSASLPGTTGTSFLRLYVTENLNWPPEGQPQPIKVETGQCVVQLEVLETREMEAGLVFVNAAAMQKSIAETGRVALYNLYFDTGKAEVKPESKATLDEIGQLLKGNPNLRLLVAGHTDTVGTFPVNQDLSLKRAQAVVAILTGQYGIDPKRLVPAGVGFASPVATNRTEPGRARNRRVELVEF
jgi:outer membrane protein OmpA-like peptidoglycan-associated protein